MLDDTVVTGVLNLVPQNLAAEFFHSEAQLQALSFFFRLHSLCRRAKGTTIIMVSVQSHPPLIAPTRFSCSDIAILDEVSNMTSYLDGQMWSLEKENILLGPYQHLSSRPGKGVREQLIAAFNTWLNVSEESIAIISKVVELLHTASLLYVR